VMSRSAARKRGKFVKSEMLETVLVKPSGETRMLLVNTFLSL
jgi:hypothetical protein